MNNKYGNKFIWSGVVEDRMDPLFLGRCRVRCVGLHTDNKVELPTEDLPWAMPLQNITSAAMNGVGQAPVGPVEGTWVLVTFFDDSYQQPLILGTIGGIPIPSENTTSETIEDFIFNGIQPQAQSVDTPPPNAVTDSSGTPIKTGSGGYVTTESPTTTTNGSTSLGNMSSDQYANLKKTIAKRESGDDYTKVEKKHGNYLGKYQMGAAALEEAGYLKPGSYKKLGTKAVQDPSAWTGKDGASSKESFLGNAKAQENAMDANIATNYKRLGLTKDVPAEKQAGLLTAAHLVGAGGAKKMMNGDNPVDGNGVGASSYYKLGYEAVAGQSTNELPTPSNVTEAAVDKNMKTLPAGVNDRAKNDPANMPNVTASATEGDSNIGFTDVNKKYPKKTWLKEPDTHRLARHQSIDKTIVYSKEQERETELFIANSKTTWEQSLIPYNAKYPFNHILESESGHTIEIDDTEGMERIHIYHRTGTFIEIDSTGTITRRTKGNECTIMENDSKTYIMGSGVLAIDGDFAIEVKKSCQIEVGGDAQIKVEGSVRQEVTGNFDLKVGGNLAMQCGGAMSFKAGPIIAGDASVIHWNSGRSESAKPVKEFTPNLKVMDPTTRQSSDDFVMEDAPPEVKQELINQKKLSNNTPKETPMKEEEKKKDTTPPPDIEPYKSDCEGVPKPYTKNTRLSTNFTLGQLCVTPGGGSSSLPPEAGQVGLTQDQIVCNLKQLCLNVLEPLKAKYPDLVINSGFRTGSGTSQHNKGMAVDLSRRAIETSGKKKVMMQDFAIEVKNTVSFDQIILETSGGPSSAWVHVSYNSGGNRPATDANKMLTINTATNTKTTGLGFA